jgi:hypothetical protein
MAKRELSLTHGTKQNRVSELMGLPKDLIARSTKRLERRKPPTAAELIKGNPIGPPLTEGQKEGYRLQAVLAARADDEREAALSERRKAEADALKAREDAIFAAYQRRVAEARG